MHLQGPYLEALLYKIFQAGITGQAWFIHKDSSRTLFSLKFDHHMNQLEMFSMNLMLADQSQNQIQNPKLSREGFVRTGSLIGGQLAVIKWVEEISSW